MTHWDDNQQINIKIYRSVRWIFICYLWGVTSMLRSSLFIGPVPKLGDFKYLLAAVFVSIIFTPNLIKIIPPFFLELLQTISFMILAYVYDELGIVFSMGCMPMIFFEELIIKSNKKKIPVLTCTFIIYILVNAWGWEAFILQSEAILFMCILISLAYVNTYRRFSQETELRAKNIELLKANEQIEKLTAEKVQQEIARDLHDTLTQDIIGINMELAVIGILDQKHDYDKLSKQIIKTQDMATGAIKQARTMIKQYREARSTPSYSSLKQAIMKIIAGFKEKYSLDTTFTINRDVKILNEQVTDIERVVAEALMNVIKHGKTKQAAVNMEINEGLLTAKIINHGQRWNPRSMNNNHFGIINMKERAKKYGGNIVLRSNKGRGVTVTATFKLKEEK
ncbi:hypothetical protein H5S09_06615 [Limosilactobacillus sp. STM2_1]|uniref:histidine kinase n=1 Tax=Limosilactobacillus rudii TaxID=2759755 RepID=A0A7W3ULC8_9LACO|nr:histidine kinase [Limosilactobacillus rudii]MBB1079565.1 hypothetical protein [Limosilactobacillus rudii]MBB1097611.1 hypothetical protein [Limosilactobacillus rudii]MCD7134720.1 histidine kinase [Limosilactobacillus rudii]